MMKNGTFWMVAALVVCGIMMACQGKDIEVKPISGTIEEAFGLESASTEVREAMACVELDERYEKTFEDTKENVEVWSLMRLSEERSSEGMGVVVVKDGQATAFPDIRHGNNPSARYDEETQILWLACGERGGVLVSASIATREKEVMREAMNRGYRLIWVRENGFPTLYKPSGESFDACSDGRLLQVSPWQYHMQRRTISREQCLELNRLVETITQQHQNKKATKDLEE